jgi:hypothetical protein
MNLSPQASSDIGKLTQGIDPVTVALDALQNSELTSEQLLALQALSQQKSKAHASRLTNFDDLAHAVPKHSNDPKTSQNYELIKRLHPDTLLSGTVYNPLFFEKIDLFDLNQDHLELVNKGIGIYRSHYEQVIKMSSVFATVSVFGVQEKLRSFVHALGGEYRRSQLKDVHNLPGPVGKIFHDLHFRFRVLCCEHDAARELAAEPTEALRLGELSPSHLLRFMENLAGGAMQRLTTPILQGLNTPILDEDATAALAALDEHVKKYGYTLGLKVREPRLGKDPDELDSKHDQDLNTILTHSSRGSSILNQHLFALGAIMGRKLAEAGSIDMDQDAGCEHEYRLWADLAQGMQDICDVREGKESFDKLFYVVERMRYALLQPELSLFKLSLAEEGSFAPRWVTKYTLRPLGTFSVYKTSSSKTPEDKAWVDNEIARYLDFVRTNEYQKMFFFFHHKRRFPHLYPPRGVSKPQAQVPQSDTTPGSELGDG